MATQSITPPAVPQPLLAGGAAGAAAVPRENEGVRFGFFQLPWVQNVLPFITSLTFHATTIIIGFLTLQAIRAIQKPATEEETIIPASNMVESEPPGGMPNVSLGGDPFKQAMQDKDPDSGTPEGFAEKNGPAVSLESAVGGSDNSNDAVIGLGPDRGFGKRASAGGGGGSDTMAMFGAPGGGGIGPKGPAVFDRNGNARTIVFVCDCTGSMINKIATLKAELAKAVMGLRPIQSFTVIFYQDEKYTVWERQLTAATPENKRRFNVWLGDIVSSGTTNPIPALELALKIHPQLMYFLTDAADFPDVNAVVQTFKKDNADKKVKVNTILFVESAAEQEENKESEPLMRGISKDNGGDFKWVRLDELE